jgi:predicted type IV restriction endonuclease
MFQELRIVTLNPILQFLLDDNNRKTICRLYLDGSKKYLVTLGEQKKEVKNEIFSLDDIFKHSETLLSIVDMYDKSKETA